MIQHLLHSVFRRYFLILENELKLADNRLLMPIFNFILIRWGVIEINKALREFAFKLVFYSRNLIPAIKVKKGTIEFFDILKNSLTAKDVPYFTGKISIQHPQIFNFANVLVCVQLYQGSCLESVSLSLINGLFTLWECFKVFEFNSFESF